MGTALKLPNARLCGSFHRTLLALRESRLLRLLERYYVLLGLLLVAIGGARIVSTYDALSLTSDEAYHLACGMQYVAEHTYWYDPQNPPLARGLQALGPYLAGVRSVGLPDGAMEGLAILDRSSSFSRTVFLMRLGNLPFFLLGCLVVAVWARHYFGKATAVLALALFALLPAVLADAGLGTTDLSLGVCVGAAFLSTLFWAEEPTWKRTAVLGISIALALLSKATALGYVPMTVGLALLAYWVSRRPSFRQLWQLARPRALPFASAMLIALVLMWAAYGFTFGVVPGRNFSMPAPRFFIGMHDIFTHVQTGHPAFLLGESRSTGWWYYYPVALLVKTPIAFLILAALGICVCLRKRTQPAYLFPLAFCAGILAPAMNSRIDIGIRHIEPIWIGLSIIAALGLLQLIEWSRTRMAYAVAAGALVLWMIVSVVMDHPDYIAYFNAFAGKHPENILVDSNYDWGQDLKLLARRFRGLGVTEFAMSSIDGGRSFSYLERWYGLPRMNVVDPIAPAPGWNVIRPTIDKSYRDRLLPGHPDVVPWYDQVQPTERVGSLALYYIPASGGPSPQQ
jgi:hypothetical protein